MGKICVGIKYDSCEFLVKLGVKPVSVEWTVTVVSCLYTADSSQAYDRLHNHDILISLFLCATNKMPVNKQKIT
jgi:hypothetical protein